MHGRARVGNPSPNPRSHPPLGMQRKVEISKRKEKRKGARATARAGVRVRVRVRGRVRVTQPGLAGARVGVGVLYLGLHTEVAGRKG